MAVLQRIRNHSVALLVIVGFAMAAFIIGDLLTSSSSIMQSSRDKVVTINGKKVTYEEFETARQRKQEFVKSMMGQELDNTASQQLTQTIYNQFLAKTLLDQTCSKMGLTVSADEVNDLVQGSHLSPVLVQYFGQEAAPQVAQFFANLVVNDSFDAMSAQVPYATRENWMELENEIVLNRLMTKYQALVTAAIQPNKLEALDNFNGDNEEVSFAYVKVSPSAVADADVKVSEDAVHEYYNSTKRNYKLSTQVRNISYIAVQLRPSQADFDAVLAEMEAVRPEFSTSADVTDLVNGNSLLTYVDAFVNNNNFSGDLKAFVDAGNTEEILEPNLQDGTIYMMARIMDKTVAPDSLNISMVVVPTKEEADSVKALMGDPVQALAGYSQQQAFSGWVTEAVTVSQFGKELSDKIMAAGKNGIFTYEVSNAAGAVYYIGKVTDMTKPVAKSKVAVYALEVTPSSATRRDEFGKLNQFLTDNKTVKEMEAAAAGSGFFMMPTTIAATAYNVGQVTDARQAVRFAFQNKKGEVSEIFECDDNLLVVAITGDIQEGYTSLKDTTFYKQVAGAYALPAAKIQKLVADINAKADKSLEAVAADYSTKVDTASFVNFNLSSVSGLGIEPSVIAAATKAEAGSVVGPIAGRNSAVLVKVLDKSGKELEYDEQARLQAVARTLDYLYAGQSAIAALSNSATIEDNRINFY